MDLLELGIHESMEEYTEYKRHYLNSHSLAVYHRDPSLFKRLRDSQEDRKDTEALAFGRALHALVCEGREAYESRYVEAVPENGFPVNPRTGACYGVTTKAAEEWVESQVSSGYTVISAEDASLVEAMNYAVQTNPAAAHLFRGGEGEITFRGKIRNAPCQCRVDYAHHDGVIIDLKTCWDIEAFEQDARKYLYWYQQGFYELLLKNAAPELNPELLFVAVEKRDPHRIAVCSFPADTIRRAKELIQEEADQCWSLLQTNGDFFSPFAGVQYFSEITTEEMKRKFL